jgi:Phage integrase family
VITTATLRDSTDWDELVDDLGLAGLVRHGLRHTALTWMADAGELHLLQRAGHQDSAATSRYLHSDVQAMLEAGPASSAWSSVAGLERPSLGVIEGQQECRLQVRLGQIGWIGLVGLARFELATP